MAEKPVAILLVEDELLIASDEQKQLEDEGYRVFIEPSGERAVAFIRNPPEPVDLILMDINLGRGMDGTQAAREILNEFDIPILFLSAHTDRGTISKTASVSSYGFVVKSSGVAVLSASIRMAINLHRALRELQSTGEAPGTEEELDGLLASAVRGRVPDEGLTTPFSILRDALESTAEALLIVDRLGKIFTYNTKFAELWGIPEDVLDRKIEDDALDAAMSRLADPDAFRKRIREIYDHPEKDSQDLWLFKDGRLIESYSRPHFVGGKPVGRVWSNRDLTERLRAEEELRLSEERHRTIASLTSDYFFELQIGEDGKAAMSWISANYTEITGRTLEQSRTPGDWASFVHKDDMGLLTTNLARLAAEGGSADIECRALVRDGRQRWVSVMARALRPPGGIRTTAIIGAVKDITARKEGEEELRRTAAQKEILRKEITHRIKNSLAVVSGLLSMETGNLADPKAREIFVNTRARVLSISSIYEQLDRSTDPGTVDLGRLISTLTDSLVKTYSPDDGRCVLKIRLDETDLDTKRAFPLALILNELITNAIKYAYPGKGCGEIRIDLAKAGGRIVLRVEDDGVGLPAGVDPARAESTGLSLVRMLAEQIDATATFVNDGGVKASIELPE